MSAAKRGGWKRIGGVPAADTATAETSSARVSSAFSRLPPAVTLWLAVGSVSAIFAIFGFVLYTSRQEVANSAWTASTNLVGLVSQQIDREIELLDMSLLRLSAIAQQRDVTVLPADLRDVVLFGSPAAARGLGALLLVDETGRLVGQAGVPSPPPIDFSAQPFFVAQKAADAGLYVSHPLTSLVDGEPIIALSRRLTRDGAFAGVAVATIKLSHIKDIYAGLDIGPHGVIALFSTDGMILMRQPFLQAATARSLPTVLIPTDASGTFEIVSPLDGVRRQIFYQRIGHLPLIQCLGRGMTDVFLLWWIRTVLIGLALLLFGSAILVMILVLQTELRRRRAAETELANLAATDKLTGLANRRRFDDALEFAWRQGRTCRRPVALLLVDVDHFKQLNDVIGHQAGDAVLAAMGACLRAFPAGSAGLVARYGGEEFVVLLPDVALEEAKAAAELLCGQVYGLGQPHPRSKTGRLTISVGVAAAVPTIGSTAADLVRAADLALYEAKHAGRNRVMTATVAAEIERAAETERAA